MTNDTKKHDTSTIVRVGMTAGVIGAAAGALAVSLSDKKNRQKVASQLDKVKKWSDKTANELKKDVKTATSSISDKTEDITGDVEEKAEEINSDAKKMSDQATKSLS